MTELSILWETASGTGDSNTSGYSDETLFQLFRSLFSRTANLGGVSPDFQNELEVTGASSPVAVGTGAALVYGIPYFNTSSVNVTIPTPASSTRIDRIVLRADWSAQTVRITRIAGTEGGGAPSLTQNAGTTWDIPLAQVSITTGGVITITDEREWVAGVGDGAITTAKLADDAVTNAKLANMAQGTIKGRVTASTGDPEDLTVSQVRTMLNVENGADVTRTAIHGANAKTTPVDGDTTALIDSADSNALKKVSWANIKATLKGYFDTLYNLYVHPNHTGDVTSNGDGATTIANNAVTTAKLADDAVTNAKLANMAQGTIKGRISSGTGDAEDLTVAQVRTMLPLTKGSFTPALAIGGQTTGIAYSFREGIWWKHGDLIFFRVMIALSSKGANTGDVTIQGFPEPFFYSFALDANWYDLATNCIRVIFAPIGAETRGSLYKQTAASASVGSSTLTHADLQNDSQFIIAGWYGVE